MEVFEVSDKKRIALETISEACDIHGCKKVFALFSGGDDSLAALRVAVEHNNFRAAVLLTTGIGVEASRRFAIDTCQKMRVPLIEYKAAENINGKGQPDPQIYEQMVLEYGFPGPTKFGHGKMYNRLKERGLRRLFREHTSPGDRVILASGCRSQESVRRMGTTKRISKEGRRVWVNHIHDWTKTDTLKFREQCGLERNPVAALICKSGECLCGGYGNEGELEELCMHDLTRPLGHRLLDIQRRVIQAGFPWLWHEGPPKWWLAQKQGQRFLFEMNKYAAPGPMCQGCEAQAERLGAAGQTR
jgi:3'-phosphoadenosine 5'-phosphosulfate sulfotransferase (PAPS reductase)/FAD synthetase